MNQQKVWDSIAEDWNRFRVKTVEEVKDFLKEPNLGDRDKLSERAFAFLENYPWSSYLDYVGKRKLAFIDVSGVKKTFSQPDQYREYVQRQ